MRRILLILVIALMLALAVVWPVLAQEQDGSGPGTAVEFLNRLMLALGPAGLAGLLGSQLTDRVKALFPFLSGEQQNELGRALTQLIAVVLSIGSAYVIAYLTPVAEFLDRSGLWQVILFAYPFAWTFFQVEYRRRLGRS